MTGDRIASTSRLEIRAWNEGDAEAFLELARDQGFNAFPITVYRQESLEAARGWIRDMIALHRATGLGKWAIIEKASGSLVGMGGLTPWTFEREELVDVTYRLRESAWGKGYGMEAAQALLRHGFETLGLDQITATITPDNAPSIRIAQKLGMALDRRILLKGVSTELLRIRKESFARPRPSC